MVHGKNRIPYWIDRRLTGLAGPEYDATISFGLPFESEDCPYGESRVRRGVAQFVEEGLITVKRHGPMASEYTLLFSDGPTPQRVSTTAQRVSILDMPSPTKKETLKRDPPPPPPGDRDRLSFQPSAGDRGYPYLPQETVKDADLNDTGTPSTNGKSSIPRADLNKLGLCKECRGPLNGSRRTLCEPCWGLYKQAQKERKAEWAGVFDHDGRTVRI